ncbi:V-type ATPase subunit [Brucepastera parasyntrophica]|uniref:V-type ATPase subunit n=1 Tax=Brucepastera parasyntrophica TaxID=2880008 RepID=UPI00210A9630|nr:V-type ATPase subunit [Brucepastera parasyntrophica]ULQ60357.1 V-type ATPase subunit [Brucepastera parasyntrophica]
MCQPALAALSKPVDSRPEWESWKYKWLLNPYEEGVPWEADPRWMQFASDKYLYHLAMVRFHQHPFTAGVLVSFFKIQQLEQQMIRVAVEGLRLGTTETQMREFMEGPQDV